MLDPYFLAVTASSIAAATVLPVANIDAPGTELNARAGVSNGALVICYQAVAGANQFTVYAFDSASVAAINSPYIVAAFTGGQWIAVAGKYVNSDHYISGGLTVATGLTVSASGAAIAGGLQVTGVTSASSVSTAGGYTSTVATGTAPFTATSTTACPNLNASLLLGGTWAVPGTIGSTTRNTALFTTVGVNGQFTSTLATGTAPFVIASTTNVANLNASSLNGATFAAPGSIGSGTPGSGAFTTLTGSDATDSTSVGTGAVVFAGGCSFNKTLWVGTNINVSGSGATPGFISNNTGAPANSQWAFRVTAAGALQICQPAQNNWLTMTHATGAMVSIGTFATSDTTDATALGTAAIVSSGGISCAKRLILDGATGKTIRIVNGVANAAVAVTFGGVGPTGSTAGNQQGWMRVDINGTDRYIPYW